MYQDSEYARILNIPEFCIFRGSEYTSGSQYARVLNMPGLHNIECSPLVLRRELKLKKWPGGCFFYFEESGGWGAQFLVGAGNLVIHKI